MSRRPAPRRRHGVWLRWQPTSRYGSKFPSVRLGPFSDHAAAERFRASAATGAHLEATPDDRRRP